MTVLDSTTNLPAALSNRPFPSQLDPVDLEAAGLVLKNSESELYRGEPYVQKGTTTRDHTLSLLHLGDQVTKDAQRHLNSNDPSTNNELQKFSQEFNALALVHDLGEFFHELLSFAEIIKLDPEKCLTKVKNETERKVTKLAFELAYVSILMKDPAMVSRFRTEVIKQLQPCLNMPSSNGDEIEQKTRATIKKLEAVIKAWGENTLPGLLAQSGIAKQANLKLALDKRVAKWMEIYNTIEDPNCRPHSFVATVVKALDKVDGFDFFVKNAKQGANIDCVDSIAEQDPFRAHATVQRTAELLTRVKELAKTATQKAIANSVVRSAYNTITDFLTQAGFGSKKTTAV